MCAKSGSDRGQRSFPDTECPESSRDAENRPDREGEAGRFYTYVSKRETTEEELQNRRRNNGKRAPH
jgi:hypothetical protein